MSNMRIPGLASGMDTDAMVQSMMKVERLKVDRYEQSRQIALWRQEAYISTNRMFANFILNTRKDMGLINTSSTGVMSSNSYAKLDYVRKATSSNETAATVSATSKAVNGSYEIKVDKLATSATYASADMRNIDLGNSISFEINGKLIEVGDGSKKVAMDDVVKAINSAKVKTLDGNKITDEEFNSLDKEVKKQVKEESLGVSAFYDKDNGRLFMQTTKTGQEAKIELTKSDGTADPFGGTAKDGVDAKIKFNDVELTYSSNNINLNGLNIQLKSEGVSTNINVNTNVDGIMEKIEKFVNDYNELIDRKSVV